MKRYNYEYSGTCTVTYSDIDQDGYDNLDWHNIRQDPLFKADGYHLQQSPTRSPCIDVGDNSAAGLPATDIDGLPRIIDGDNNRIATVDMGADEQSDGVELILSATALSSNHILLEWLVLDPGPVTSYVLYRNNARIATLTATGSSSTRYSDVIGVEPGTPYKTKFMNTKLPR